MIVTQTMLENRVGADELVRLTDDAGTGSVNASVMARAIDEGEGELLNNIGQRYVLPLALSDTNTASVVQGMMIDAVVYRLYMRRDHAVTEEHTAAYRHAVEWSEKIAAGKLGLLGETERSESPSGVGQVIVDGSSRVISRETTQGL